MATRPPIVSFRGRGAAGGFLRVYRREPAAWPYHAARMHGHRFFVLNYTTHGTGTLRTPRETVRIGAGHVFLTAPGELHDTSGVQHVGGWNVEFTAELIGSAAMGPALASPPLPADVAGATTAWLAFAGRRAGLPARARIPPKDRAGWDQILVRLEREATATHLGAREAMRALVTLLLVDLARLLAPAGAHAGVGSPLVQEVFRTIEGRFAEPGLSLSSIARAVGRSASHVTAVVRAETGMTVLEWLTERRMAEARRRLQETDEDVAIVGERVGFLDPAYFARRFRSAHGLSPRAYRKAAI